MEPVFDERTGVVWHPGDPEYRERRAEAFFWAEAKRQGCRVTAVQSMPVCPRPGQLLKLLRMRETMK